LFCSATQAAWLKINGDPSLPPRLTGGPIIGGNWSWKALVRGLELAIADVLEPATAVTFLSVHLLVNKPEGMNVAGNVAKDSQTNVDKEVTAASCNECSCSWGEYDGNNNEQDVGWFDTHCRKLLSSGKAGCGVRKALSIRIPINTS